MKTIPSASSRLGYVDQLRGTAILMVIAVHQSAFMVNLPQTLRGVFKAGQLGVQLFFVVSALTLCISHERRQHENFAYIKYLIRRLFRIAPLYYVGIAIFALSFPLRARFGIGGLVSPYTIHNILANALFIHGFVPSATNSVLPGGWSIGTEMAFYLIFPTLFAFSASIYERFGLVGETAMSVVLCAASVGACFILLRMYGYDFSNNSFGFFNLLNQLPAFVVGTFLYFFLRTRSGHMAKTGTVAALLGSIAIALLTGAVWHAHYDFSFVLVPGLASVSFLLFVLAVRSARFFLPKLEEIGKLSYSMYIIHFFFVGYGSKTALKVFHHALRGGLASFFTVLAVNLIITLGVAKVLQRFVEEPGIALGRKVVAKIDFKSLGKEVAVNPAEDAGG